MCVHCLWQYKLVTCNVALYMCQFSGHRYIELFLMSHPSSGGGVSGLVGGPVGGGGGGVVGGGVGRGGLRGGGMTARYPAQASWTDPRGTQVWVHICIYHIEV